MTVSLQFIPWKERLLRAEAGPRSTLTYELLDDLGEIPVEEIVDTYLWVMGGTTIDRITYEGMLPLWLHGYLVQKDKYRRSALLPLLGEGMTFSWKLLETWKTRFRELKMWPDRWIFGGTETAPTALTRQQVINMLDLFIVFKIINRRDAAKITPTSLYFKRGWELRSIDEKHAKLVEGMARSVILEDWRTYPPFFPGDDTWIGLKARAPRAQEHLGSKRV